MPTRDPLSRKTIEAKFVLQGATFIVKFGWHISIKNTVYQQ
jgi:hypothetical protein